MVVEKERLNICPLCWRKSTVSDLFYVLTVEKNMPYFTEVELLLSPQQWSAVSCKFHMYMKCTPLQKYTFSSFLRWQAVKYILNTYSILIKVVACEAKV